MTLVPSHTIMLDHDTNDVDAVKRIYSWNKCFKGMLAKLVFTREQKVKNPAREILVRIYNIKKLFCRVL